MSDRVLVETELDAPVDVVWGALREPDLVRRWFGWDAEGLVAEIEQIFLDEPTADDEARTLTWPHGDRFALAPRESRTLLRLTRRDHEGTDSFDGVHDPIDEGWITFVQQLRFWVERHRGAERRTLSAVGVDLGPEEDPLLTRLGLRSLGEDPVGAPYRVERSDGSGFGGEVFFQTDLQVGLSVEDEGDGLLVIARTPPASAPPAGQVMFILNLYGDAADPARFAEAEERWSGWWGDGSTSAAAHRAGPSGD
ncbi:MAG: hypothetical protein JWP95_847 [Actinotalea sp.]|nr:hypothetical protein [Actinotalea sp.]